MFRTLRFRLIVSHVFPFLVLLPLLGFALVYVLERQILLPRLAEDLTTEARLLAQISRVQFNRWGSPLYYEFVLTSANPNPDVHVMFLSPQGQILYSSQPEEQNLLGNWLQIDGLDKASNGQTVATSQYSGLLLP